MTISTANLTYVERPLRLPSMEETKYISGRDLKESGFPPDLLAWKRFSDAIDDMDGYYVGLPYSHFSYIIEEKGIFADFFHCPYVARLRDVRQLGAVSMDNCYLLTDSSKRFAHSLFTAMPVDIVLTNNGFTEEERNLGIAAAMLHDAALPPYSDQGKKLIPLNEELEMEGILRDTDVRKLLEKYGVNGEDVSACIEGKHFPIGNLINGHGELDMDRLAYMANDVARLHPPPPTGRSVLPDDIIVRLQKNPYVFDAYLEMKRSEEGWYFTWPPRVAEILRIRAEMFRHLYHNETNTVREAMLEKAFESLGRSLPVPRERILRMGERNFIILSSAMRLRLKISWIH